MKTSSKIYLIVFLLILLTLAYFAYPIIKERYFSSSQQVEIIAPDNSENQKVEPDQESTKPTETDALQNIQSNDDVFIPENETSTFREIKKEDCLNECTTFDSDKEKNYCLQVCDASSQSDNASENCSEKSGLEKDYCHKELGIKNNDFDECKKITDKNIRTSCANIITDKILERSETSEQNP